MEIVFGAERLSDDDGTEHVAIVGGTGSGKTTCVKMIMESTLTEPADFPPAALIYDPKKEFLPVLDGMGRLEDCVILNPFDRRCAAWNVAADITSPVDARQFATILTQGEGSGEQDGKFFKNAVRDVATAVATTLINVATPGSWTFRDFLLGCLYPNYLDFLLGHHYGRDGLELSGNVLVKEVYFTLADYRTAANIRASIQSELGKYQPIAAAWDAALRREDGAFPNRFSLREWVESGDILILGNDESARASIDPINQVLFQRAGELLLNRPSRTKTAAMARTWIYLDEVREAGKLPILSRLFNKSRAHGVTLVLSFQDFEGIKAEYGHSVAIEIVAQCGNKLFLKLDSPDSARWASEAFGSFVAPEQSVSRSNSSQGSSSSESWHRAERRNVETSDFLFMPKAGPKNGIPGFYKHSGQDPAAPLLFRTANWLHDVKPYLPRETTIEGFLPHESEEVFYLRTWDRQDWDRLGFESELIPPFSPQNRDEEHPE